MAGQKYALNKFWNIAGMESLVRSSSMVSDGPEAVRTCSGEWGLFSAVLLAPLNQDLHKQIIIESLLTACMDVKLSAPIRSWALFYTYNLRGSLHSLKELST